MDISDQADSLLKVVHDLAPHVRSLIHQIETQRRLPQSLVDAMAAAGLFRLLIPRSMGGLEVDVATFIQAIEAAAALDGSVGWSAMIGATGGLTSGYLPLETAQEIYGSDPHIVTAGAFAPHGRARPVEGGYRVTGRWPFNSGCEYCAWLMGNCIIHEADEAPRLRSDGQPDIRLMLFPAAEADIIDTWSVSGLRGSGSHDIAIQDLFIPEERTVAYGLEPPTQPGPLYAFPTFGLLAISVASVAVGIARGSIDCLIEVARTKIPTGGRRPLCERPFVHMQLAQAQARFQTARAGLLAVAQEIWDMTCQGEAVPLEQRAAIRLAANHATSESAAVVDAMYTVAGTSAIWDTSPLQRAFRDIHVLTQHAVIAPPLYELAGRVLFGLRADTSML
ncbi:MAG: acyl-CoA dehydrogenase family protein [Nitrospinae bacterium]|nr:acyl-CoA dehydrogenase family protein [Nitrospinota bacterium]